MKAFTQEKYGPPETLRLADVDKPAPNADEVLVKVLAVSVNPADWHSMRGQAPLLARHSGLAAAEAQDPRRRHRRARWRRSAAALPSSSPATRSTPISWTTATAASQNTFRCQLTSCR